MIHLNYSYTSAITVCKDAWMLNTPMGLQNNPQECTLEKHSHKHSKMKVCLGTSQLKQIFCSEQFESQLKGVLFAMRYIHTVCIKEIFSS